MQRDLVLVVDFGSQVTQLIARRLRETGVYCEIVPPQAADPGLESPQLRAVVLSGGPDSVADDAAPGLPPGVLEAGVPVLGICYGQQLLVHALGGEVGQGSRREYGPASLRACADSRLLEGFADGGGERAVWMSHGDEVRRLPEGFATIAESAGAPHAAIADEERRIYGVQFHPEVAHTPGGDRLLANFAIGIAGCRGDWSMAAYRTMAVERIRERVGGERVICGLSGGVDSAVAAALVHEAIGERLACVFVDTGLLRKDEGAQVADMFRRHFQIPLVRRDASDAFLAALDGVEDPEAKRHAIGRLFVEEFEAALEEAGPARFLAQGTLYPDVIESASVHGGPSATIKSHHNVGGLPDDMPFELLEPLRELFKDEVRALGRELGLPADFVDRHPFPGPGLAIRIPGAVTREALNILREADAVFLEEIRAAGLYDDIWQAFAALLPVRSVGVMGDARTYERVCALRAVRATDGMTADFYPFSAEFLSKVATRIVNEVRGVNRVVYDVTSKPPATIEWE